MHAGTFKDRTDRIELVDDRTIVFHFKRPFLEFLELYNGVPSGIGWVLPKSYYARVGPRVLPEGNAQPGEGFHRYWATPQAPFPWPWEEWEVKG